jgi:hypothetical protein
MGRPARRRAVLRKKKTTESFGSCYNASLQLLCVPTIRFAGEAKRTTTTRGQAMGEVWKIILTVAVTTIVGAVLAFAGNALSGGGVIRALGGVSASQLLGGTTYQVGINCHDHREAIMTIAKRGFCFLTDVSIRPGGAPNKDGWDVCKIVEGAGGRFVLVAEMYRTCPKPEEAEISCKASCVEF